MMYVHCCEAFQSLHVWKSLFHLHFWKTLFLGVEFLAELSFGTLKMLLRCVLICTASMRSLLSFFSLFICGKVLFLPLAGFKIFLLVTSFEHFDHDVPWCYFLTISCAWGLLRFLVLCIHVIQIFVLVPLGTLGTILEDFNLSHSSLFSIHFLEYFSVFHFV